MDREISECRKGAAPGGRLGRVQKGRMSKTQGSADNSPPSFPQATSGRIQEHGFSLADLYQLDTEVKQDITLMETDHDSLPPPSHTSSQHSVYGMDFGENAESSSSRLSARRHRTRASRTDSFEILINGVSEPESIASGIGGRADRNSLRVSPRRRRTRASRTDSFEILSGGNGNVSEPESVVSEDSGPTNRRRNLRPKYRKTAKRVASSEVTSASCGSAYEGSDSDHSQPAEESRESTPDSAHESDTASARSRSREASRTSGPSSVREKPVPVPRLGRSERPDQPKNQGGQVSMSTEALEPIFAAAEAEHIEDGTPIGDLQIAIAKQVYALATWTVLFADYRNKAGRFAPGGNVPKNMSEIKDIDEILRNAHLRAWSGRGFRGVLPHLLENYPVEGQEYRLQAYWSTHYSDWRRHAGRFLQSEDDERYRDYLDIYPKYINMVKKGSSIETIATKIAKDHPSHELTTSEWDRFFGIWIRSQVPGESWQVALDPALYASHPSYQKEVFKNEFATVFREHFDAPAWRPLPVAEILSPKTGLTLKYLKDMYRAWRRAAGRFKTCALELQYSGQGEYIPEPEFEFGKIGASTVKVPEHQYVNRILEILKADRIAISKIPQLKGTNSGRKNMTIAIWAKIFRNNYNSNTLVCQDVGNTLAPLTGFSIQTIKHMYHRWRTNGHAFEELAPSLEFTNDGPIAPIPALKALPKKPVPAEVVSAKDTWWGEYEEMAVYISVRLPVWTAADERDWTDFAAANPQRTAKQWENIFRNFRQRVYDHIPELRGLTERSAIEAKRVACVHERRAKKTPESIKAAKAGLRDRRARKSAAMTMEEREAFNAKIRKKRRDMKVGARQSDVEISGAERVSGGEDENGATKGTRKRKRGGVSTRLQQARSDDEADMEVDDLI